MALDLVVFDCDGVLLETVEVKTRAFGRTVEEFGPQAVQRLLDYHMAHGGVSRYKKFEWFYAEVLGRTITDKEMQDLGERFTKFAFEEVVAAPAVDGALETIQALYGKVPMYVASGAPHDELTYVLEAKGLTGYFQGIFGSPPHKTALLADILRHTGADPQKTVMVGDSSTDLEAATACGTRYFGRGSSFATSGHPWAEDLHPLKEHLLRLLAEV
ncbi:HAD family hydrolase [Oleidesulfovibrio sp.]|uniref:HAD family hydrolase n=1 Tax=Oleidesulfovibrio sp. TaxID=2909707 RepID=UPI003A8B1605